MNILKEYKSKLSYLDLEDFSSSNDVIFIIDNNFKLVAFNNAWTEFARRNEGQDVLSRYPLGADIRAAFSQEILRFYEGFFSNAIKDQRRFEHDYECSSPSKFRLFHQSAYPLRDGCGLIITNHLLNESPLEIPGKEMGREYLNENELVIQCCHCRKVKNQGYPEKWDWVPILIAKPNEKTSHTFCPYCMEYYYNITESFL